MRRKFKVKKKLKLKKIVIVLILLFVILIVNYITNNLNFFNSHKELINNIFEINNTYSYNESKNNNLIYKTYNYIKEKIFNSPIILLKTQLNYNPEIKESVDLVYQEKVEPQKPIIYIYNSHQGETYSMEYLEEYNIVPDVLVASNMLKDKLNNVGIESVVEESDILAYMKENNLNHAGSYKASRYFLTKALQNYPDAKLFIDLHRDAATKNITTTTIEGKKCARVMFVIGLEYNTYKENLEIVNKINNIILNKYPTLTRGIMKKRGYGVNGIYNQDLSNNVILMEVGGHENNIEEINNSLELIAEVIGEYLNEEKEEQ